MSSILRRSGARAGRAACFAMLMLALAAAGARADVYAVAGVKVEGTGARPELARAQAVASGEMLAFGRLLRKLTLAEDHSRLPTPAAEAVRAAVRNFSIEEENGRGARYLATITYRFDRETVRGMLEGAGVPFVDAPSPPLVVLPVWAEGGKRLLWDDPNPWREAWMRHEPRDAMVDFARVRGDLTDLRAISGDEAAAGKREALDRIADIYKAGLVAVTIATEDKGKRRITIQLYDLANRRNQSLGTITTAADAAALDKAAAEVMRRIDTSWKRNAVALEQNAVVARIRIPLKGLDQWIRIRQALQGMAQMRNLNTISMSPGEALIEVRFAGTLPELRRQLEQKGMSLTADPAAAAGAQAWLLQAPEITQTDLPPNKATPPAKSDAPPAGDKTEPPKKP